MKNRSSTTVGRSRTSASQRSSSSRRVIDPAAMAGRKLGQGIAGNGHSVPYGKRREARLARRRTHRDEVRSSHYLISGVDVPELRIGPFHCVLGRHALHSLSIHVGDQVLAQAFGRLTVGRTGIAGETAGARRRPGTATSPDLCSRAGHSPISSSHRPKSPAASRTTSR